MGRETAGWTLADAATWLDPPISPERLGLLVRAADVNAIGHRKPPPGSAGGRPAAVYEIRELQELHAAFVPWLLRIEGRALPWLWEPLDRSGCEIRCRGGPRLVGAASEGAVTEPGGARWYW